ncbi:MAG: hypothetical protein PHN57_00290 [Candidatus Omnitrophica bacterium]|nr:hypothetical protein [Candidatus Omnitrophota bacterium]
MRKIILFLVFIFIFSSAYAQEISTNIKSLLSSEGKILYGNEPNSIVVIDYPENVKRIAEYLNLVDLPPQQVLIEARVVEVKLQKEHALGVNWQLFADKGYLPLGQLKLGSATTFGQPGPLSQSLAYKNTFFPPGQTATGSENPFTIAVFDDNINVILETLASALDTDILSAPQITTVNNREAQIKVIQSYPWAEPSATTDANGNITLTWTIHFEEIGITLKVTPTINEDGKISMVLDPEVSEKTGDLPLTTSGLTYNVPIIDRRNASTKVIIGNGQTLIIGGLIKDKITKGESKVPFLGDIPGFGYFFKSTRDTRDKTELLIFVSPTIITPDVFTHMAKQEKYIYGRGYSQEREDKEKQILIREDIEKRKKEEALLRLECLTREHSALVAERKNLESQIGKQEKGLKY